ncbi:MAG: HAD family phosphatase [Oscillospiraceae bacterium]
MSLKLLWNGEKMKISGCIFDLDGTLLNSMPLWDKVGFDFLVKWDRQPKDDFNKRLRSMSMPQTAHYFIDEYNISQTPEEVKKGINDIMEIKYKTIAYPKDFVIDFLDKMAEKNVKMCIASATDKYLIEYALKANNMMNYFSEIFSCTDLGFGKNYPNIYNAAIEHLGTEKSSTFVFEDALYAIKTAKAADFNVVGIYDEYSNDEVDEIKSISDIFVNSFAELNKYFD